MDLTRQSLYNCVKRKGHLNPKLIQCFQLQKQLEVTNHPITFRLNIEYIQNLINKKFKNDIARTILSKIFNEFMDLTFNKTFKFN